MENAHESMNWNANWKLAKTSHNPMPQPLTVWQSRAKKLHHDLLARLTQLSNGFLVDAMALVNGQSTAMQGTPEYVMQRILNICPTCRGTQKIQLREHVKPDCENFKKNGTGVGCMVGECFAKVDKYCPNCESIKLIFQDLENHLVKVRELNGG